MVHSCFHATPALTSPTGAPIGAVFVFTKQLCALVSDVRPTRCVAAIEGGGNWRRDRVPTYKASRSATDPDIASQLDLAAEISAAFGFSVVQGSHSVKRGRRGGVCVCVYVCVCAV